MTKLGIKYKELIDLGFTREVCSDSVFFDEYGYNFFILNFDIHKYFKLSYCAEDEFVELLVLDDKNTILHKDRIKDIEVIKRLVYKAD